MEILFLILALGIILLSSEFFTNGVEVLGENLCLSQAVAGSVLAAVGTALPETIIPLVAIFFYKGKAGSSIGVGAILGAPFMLTTMGLFLVGIGIYLRSFLNKLSPTIHIEKENLIRDFGFFLVSYSVAIFFPFFFPNTRFFHYIIVIFLFLNYFLYLFLTFKAESAGVCALKELYLIKSLKILNIYLGKTFVVILAIFQVVVSIFFMIKGAHLFVHNLEILAKKFGIDPLLFALLIAPIATELPEKFNSFIWTLREKDVLALGNITGAIVFQSTFPVSVGLIFTSWKIYGLALISALIVIFLSLFYFLIIKSLKRLPPAVLLISGLFYIFYVVLVLHRFKKV